MKTSFVILVIGGFLLIPVRGHAQSTVPWSVISMGFMVSSYPTANPTTMVKSLVGQVFVGRMTGPSSIIEAGFLADTLLRGPKSSVAASEGIPKEYVLRQNYPNPFNPSTTIRFELPREARVSLKVYGLLGQEVASLVDEEKPAGMYEVRFDGGGQPSGMYFYRLHAGDYVATKRLMLLK